MYEVFFKINFNDNVWKCPEKSEKFIEQSGNFMVEKKGHLRDPLVNFYKVIFRVETYLSRLSKMRKRNKNSQELNVQDLCSAALIRVKFLALNKCCLPPAFPSAFVSTLADNFQKYEIFQQISVNLEIRAYYSQLYSDCFQKLYKME